jgi:hypothetical protein
MFESEFICLSGWDGKVFLGGLLGLGCQKGGVECTLGNVNSSLLYHVFVVLPKSLFSV